MNNYIRNILREEAGEPGMDGSGTGTPVEDSGDAGAPADESSAWYKEAGFSDEALANEKFVNHLNRYKSQEEALKGGWEAKQALSKKIEDNGFIKAPGEDATDEARAEFFNKLGRPETPDKYTWKPEEGVEMDPEIYAERSKEMHDAGFTDSQHKAAMELYSKELQRIQSSIQEQQNEIASKSEATLREEWKDDYDSNIQQAVKVAEKYDLVDDLKESGVINNHKVIKMLHEVAISTGEGTVKPSDGFSSSGEERSALKKHPAYNDKTHPEHEKVVKRVVELSMV